MEVGSSQLPPDLGCDHEVSQSRVIALRIPTGHRDVVVNLQEPVCVL